MVKKETTHSMVVKVMTDSMAVREMINSITAMALTKFGEVMEKTL
jgi:hypothetical protein